MRYYVVSTVGSDWLCTLCIEPIGSRFGVLLHGRTGTLFKSKKSARAAIDRTIERDREAISLGKTTWKREFSIHRVAVSA